MRYEKECNAFTSGLGPLAAFLSLIKIKEAIRKHCDQQTLMMIQQEVKS